MNSRIDPLTQGSSGRLSKCPRHFVGGGSGPLDVRWYDPATHACVSVTITVIYPQMHEPFYWRDVGFVIQRPIHIGNVSRSCITDLLVVPDLHFLPLTMTAHFLEGRGQTTIIRRSTLCIRSFSRRPASDFTVSAAAGLYRAQIDHRPKRHGMSSVHGIVRAYLE